MAKITIEVESKEILEAFEFYIKKDPIIGKVEESHIDRATEILERYCQKKDSDEASDIEWCETIISIYAEHLARQECCTFEETQEEYDAENIKD